MAGKIARGGHVTLWAVVLLYCARSSFAGAASPENETGSAIAALLAASSLPVHQGSSCHGVLPGIAKPSLGDVVASRLDALDGGRNTVTAHCETSENPPVCHVIIAHADGEDVSSAEFRFHLVGGRLDSGSLVCVLTP